MITELFIPLVVLCLVLIFAGFIFKTHTELAILGFVFLFVLSTQLSQGAVQYRTGSNITASIGYNGTSASVISQSIDYKYVPFNDATSTMIGKYLSYGAAFGFVIVMILVVVSI